ncbi:hypothetical protein BAMY6639_15140 [Bacillus amyloliquefaciens UMAF6639]|nr:hypothetical protein BAMY6639_15140 [Bacillus amyloliquefaciens UMAF6639]
MQLEQQVQQAQLARPVQLGKLAQQEKPEQLE